MKWGRTFAKVACVAFVLLSCSKDKPTEPTSLLPVISGTVINGSDSSVIENANVLLYDANKNEPVSRMFTDENGHYLFIVEVEGAYYLRIEAQGYYPIPAMGGSPIPFQAPLNDTTWQDISLDPNPDAGTLGGFSGYIETGADQPVPGALVIATSAGDSYSGTSGPDGYYVFYNIAPGTYEIESHIAGYLQQSSNVSVDVTAGSFNQVHIDILMVSGTFGTVTGHVSFIAVSNPDSGIDITLIHPESREAIPGLSTFIDPNVGNYNISDVPFDTYIVWASYRNDGYVMDPDAIHKFGLPIVTLSQSNPDTTIDFKVTGAILLESPTNPADSVYPVTVETRTPTFTWTKTSSYSSAKEYVVEVLDRKGRVIWGGFDSTGIIHHQQIASSTPLSVVFNFDGSATDTLVAGEIYRWKVYADDDANANIQTLLSSSEYLMGLFKVVADTTGAP